MNAIVTRSKKHTSQHDEPIGVIISRNLRYLIQKSGLTEVEIARRIDCPMSTLNRMCRGKMADPKISIIRKLSSFFEVPVSTFFSETLSYDFEGYTLLPLLEWDELSDIDNFNKLVSSHTERTWQPVNIEVSKDSFLLRCKKSMSTKFPIGTIFVVDPDIQPIDGDTVILYFRDSNIYSARELIIDSPQWQLKSIHDDSPPIMYQASEHRIIGIVVEKRFFQSR